MPLPLVLIGPTAVGKTDLALLLAKKTQGEVISMDSMQIYRGMDIGTAMYVKGLVEGLFDGPGRDEALREELRAVLAEKGPEYLRDEVLRPLDPVSAERLHPNDTLRVIRAIEVSKLSGKPFSEQTKQWNRKAPIENYRMVGLTMPRELLYKRIEKRVDLMMEAGLEAEVRKLMREGLEKNLTAAQAIGYKELIAYVHGEYDLERAVELIKRNTRRFAKHQLTWFRNNLAAEWYDVTKYPDREKLAQVILEKESGLE